MDHTNAIQAITDHIRDQPDIKALFLGGSHAQQTSDDVSDIDFVLVAEAGANDDVAACWRSAVTTIGEIVLWWDRQAVPVLINAITVDWVRIDVVILAPDQLGHQTQAGLVPLFDPDGLYDTLTAAAPKRGVDARRETYQIEEFLRVLGLLHVAIGRDDPINAVTGLMHLRTLLIELMIAETDAPHRGGALHLHRLITPSQKAVLSGLPALVPKRSEVIDAHLAYAQAYLPRARVRAKKLGIAWPEAFEQATWDQLQCTLNVTRPAHDLPE